jgi:polyisoprenoid-binding protein YceI
MLLRFSALAVLALACAPLQATTYTLEPNYTQGVIRWDHLGFVHPTAQFSQGEGSLDFDPAHPTQTKVKVTIPLASLHTGVSDLDEDFRSEDFFDTDKYTTAVFTSSKVEPGTVANQFKVSGDLQLHGATKQVQLNLQLIKTGLNPLTHLPTIGFEAMATLKRSDFGLGKYVPYVADEVQIQIITEVAEAKAYALYLKTQAEKEAAAKKAGNQ